MSLAPPDPPRLSQLEGYDGELLRAARGETAPARSRERVLASVGVGAAATTLTAAKTAGATKLLGLAAWLKVATACAVVGAVGVGTARWVRTHDAHRAAAPVVAATSAPSGAPRARVAEIAASSAVAASVVSPVPAPSILAPATAASATVAAPKPSANSSTNAIVAATEDAPSADPIAPELSLLDSARAALAANDAARALSTLDGYAAKFPSGVLAPEATVLRVDALRRLGRDADARALAERFLEKNGASPLAKRVRAMLATIP